MREEKTRDEQSGGKKDTTSPPEFDSFEDLLKRYWREEADRLRHSALEYQKTDYDFYKHLMTLALAAIAAFVAILGGGSLDSSHWRGDFTLTLWWLSLSRSQLISITFISLFLAAFGACTEARIARDNIYRLGRLETPEEITKFQEESRIIRQLSGRSINRVAFVGIPFAIAWVGLLVLISGSN